MQKHLKIKVDLEEFCEEIDQLIIFIDNFLQSNLEFSKINAELKKSRENLIAEFDNLVYQRDTAINLIER